MLACTMNILKIPRMHSDFLVACKSLAHIFISKSCTVEFLELFLTVAKPLAFSSQAPVNPGLVFNVCSISTSSNHPQLFHVQFSLLSSHDCQDCWLTSSWQCMTNIQLRFGILIPFKSSQLLHSFLPFVKTLKCLVGNNFVFQVVHSIDWEQPNSSVEDTPSKHKAWGEE